MAPKLAVKGLSKSFGALEALRDIDVEVERGGFVSVVGPSGCGKTTFLRIVAGLEPASAGASTAASCTNPAATAASYSRPTAFCRGGPCSPMR